MIFIILASSVVDITNGHHGNKWMCSHTMADQKFVIAAASVNEALVFKFQNTMLSFFSFWNTILRAKEFILEGTNASGSILVSSGSFTTGTYTLIDVVSYFAEKLTF